MDNLALTGKALTLATILALCHNPGHSGEEYMALAPNATTQSDIDASRPTLHRNTIKLQIPSPEAMELNHMQMVEINPASSNGVLNFNLPDSPTSFMPLPPGSETRLTGVTRTSLEKSREASATKLVDADPATPTPTQTDTPPYRTMTSATIIIPAAQTVLAASNPTPAAEPVLASPPTPTSATIAPQTKPLTPLRPIKSLRPTSGPGTSADPGLMPGLITPEQLATGGSYDMTPFALGRAELSDLVSFQPTLQSLALGTQSTATHTPVTYIPESYSSVPYASEPYSSTSYVAEAYVSEPNSAESHISEPYISSDSYIAESSVVEPSSAPLYDSAVIAASPIFESSSTEPVQSYAVSSFSTGQDDIMAMAAPPAPVTNSPVSGNTSSSTLDPALLQFDPAAPRSAAPSLASPTASRAPSFHSLPPAFSQPASSSGPALPPPQSNDTDSGSTSSGPLRLSITPLVNISTPLDTPLIGTVAAGQASLPPPSRPVRSAPAPALTESRMAPGPDTTSSSASRSLALTPSEFSSPDIPQPQQRATERRESFEPSVKAPKSQRQTRRQSRKREREEARERTMKGFTNMRDVRSVIGPPDPTMFR